MYPFSKIYQPFPKPSSPPASGLLKRLRGRAGGFINVGCGLFYAKKLTGLAGGFIQCGCGLFCTKKLTGLAGWFIRAGCGMFYVVNGGRILSAPTRRIWRNKRFAVRRNKEKARQALSRRQPPLWPVHISARAEMRYNGGMNFEDILKSGMSGEIEAVVTEKNTAEAFGSGGLAVFATPYMAALMEGACLSAVDPHLPEGFSTVGTALDIKHIAPTPVGMTVRASCVLTAVDGRELHFETEAFDEKEKIGEGLHKRFIVENEKFLKKVQAKK
jgi:predicted thioesterase